MRFVHEIGLIAALAAAATGCVNREQARLREAREDHRACVEQHGESAPECRALREVVREEFERYEQAAQRQWGDRERDRTWAP